MTIIKTRAAFLEAAHRGVGESPQPTTTPRDPNYPAAGWGKRAPSGVACWFLQGSRATRTSGQTARPEHSLIRSGLLGIGTWVADDDPVQSVLTNSRRGARLLLLLLSSFPPPRGFYWGGNNGAKVGESARALMCSYCPPCLAERGCRVSGVDGRPPDTQAKQQTRRRGSTTRRCLSSHRLP